MVFFGWAPTEVLNKNERRDPGSYEDSSVLLLADTGRQISRGASEPDSSFTRRAFTGLGYESCCADGAQVRGIKSETPEFAQSAHCHFCILRADGAKKYSLLPVGGVQRAVACVKHDP